MPASHAGIWHHPQQLLHLRSASPGEAKRSRAPEARPSPGRAELTAWAARTACRGRLRGMDEQSAGYAWGGDGVRPCAAARGSGATASSSSRWASSRSCSS